MDQAIPGQARRVTIGDAKRHMDQAVHTLDLIKRWIEKAPYLHAGNRAYLMCVLMHASLDYGRAMARVLKDDPVGLGAVGTAMLRPQIETFMRGAWIFLDANEAQIDEYVRNDKLRRRKAATSGCPATLDAPHDGNDGEALLELKDTMGIFAVAKRVEERLARLGVTDIVPMSTYVTKEADMPNGLWATLNGQLHGGNILLRLYMQDDEVLPRIAPAAQYRNLAATATMSVTFAFYAAAIVGHAVSDRDPSRKINLVDAVMKFRSRHEEFLARLNNNQH